MKTFNRKNNVPHGREKLLLLAVILFTSMFCFGCSDDDNPHFIPEIIEPTQPRMKMNETDSLIMVKLYNAIGPWVTGGWDLHDYTTWLGVSTAFDLSRNELRVVGFDVVCGNFHGNFPEDICNLTELRTLIMCGGRLEGNIPESIGNLEHLEYLQLGDFYVTGNLPESIGNLVNLKWLQLSNMPLNGNIPESIGNLTSLKHLQITNTNISGEIPKSLANLKNCEQIWLDRNKLSGTFPIEIALNRVIYCDVNNIEELPIEIWDDANDYLIPDLQGNRISTNIPKWVTKQVKWKTGGYKFIERQQAGYGYKLLEQ